MLEAVANILLAVGGIAAYAVWLVALCKWDGELPCKPDDCKDCEQFKKGHCEGFDKEYYWFKKENQK